MERSRKLWYLLALVFFASFAALGYIGRQIYLAAPPIPSAVQAKDGTTIYTSEDVQLGQQAWLAAGGQQVGSVWGHGAYIAPDWSADWLHREAVELRENLSRRDYGAPYDGLTERDQTAVDQLLKSEMRRNTYDASTGIVQVSAERARAITRVAEHFEGLFGGDPAFADLRDQYAMASGALPDAVQRKALTAFFFWSAWSTCTDRPGETGLSYTSNWPYEPLVGNAMTTSAAMWSIASIILLIAAIAAMIWYHAAHKEPPDPQAAANDPLLNAVATPSMRATRKYFFVVIALILTQVAMGGITAHYGVEGNSFYGFPLADFLPYAVSRTIHTQLGVLWIATAWLATGLFMAPVLSGYEPRYQKLGVDVLFWALLVVVVGSIAVGWVGTLQHRGTEFSFWVGNQGLEYTSMGRAWQIGLFLGLLLWLFLLGRALWPALKRPSETRGLITMVFLAATCIGGFYASSLMWGQHTHYAMIEYWRWWLVHLWVEGFFEVFATAVVALIFTRLGLIATSSAQRAILLETIVFLLGGILGTLHHLYWTGTPTSVIAVGAVFSALEVVPLALIGLEGWSNYQRSKAAPWVRAYRWPILCFVAVGFWNTVGAGLLGFTINPPASLYYVQGLNLTPAHGHAALFGVYGMLGIGLMLFCLRTVYARHLHSDRLLGWMFWGLNAGLAMMVFMSLVPAGIYQAAQSMSHGLWFARSPKVVHSHLMETFVWLRMPGDIVFALGAAFLALYGVKLLRRPAVAFRRPAYSAVNIGKD